MTHIDEAQNTAHDLEDVETTHPAYVQLTLRGILHALLALHEQNEPKPKPKATPAPRKAAPKESK
jgi:hypothetical protein